MSVIIRIMNFVFPLYMLNSVIMALCIGVESYLIRYKNGEVPFLANLYMSKVIEHKIYPLYSRENLAIWNNRVENEVIELPIKSDGTPDFEYMERYIRAMEKVVIADMVKYKDNVIETTKKVVGD